jgi:hypothetical protein
VVQPELRLALDRLAAEATSGGLHWRPDRLHLALYRADPCTRFPALDSGIGRGVLSVGGMLLVALLIYGQVAAEKRGDGAEPH